MTINPSDAGGPPVPTSTVPTGVVPTGAVSTEPTVATEPTGATGVDPAPTAPSPAPTAGSPLPAPPPPPPPPPPPVRLTRRAARARGVGLKDEDKVQRASWSVGWTVGLAAAAIVVISMTTVLAVAVHRAVQVSVTGPGTFPNWPNYGPRPVPRWGWVSADDMVWVVLSMAVVSVVLTGLVGWWAARRAVKPLADALRLQRHFVADASHELRTPLTALSSRIQILQRRLDAGKDIHPVVAQLQTDADQMAQTLNDLLLTTEGARPTDAANPVLDCVHQAAASLSALAEQAGVTIMVWPDAQPLVLVPAASLTRAVVAVIDNAIQHSPAGSEVEVRVGLSGDNAVIRVRDHGSGIVGVDPSQVFERFAHGTETGKRRSFGLGLALTSEVAHRFGGEIAVEASGDQGTTFALTFPAAG